MYWGGGLLLTLLVISGSLSYLKNFSYTLDSVEDYSSSGVTFAIYLNDGYDNYVEYEGDTFPAKADGYKYNADISNCTDIDGNSSNNYTLYYNNDMVQVSTQESIYCYIYFDMYSYDGDYCLVNNITDNLGECALVMDDYSYTVELAKESIEDKGKADTSKIAPTITFGKSISTSQTVSISTTSYFSVGTDYDFDTTTGYYSLKNISKPSTLTDDYIGYYTCGSTDTSCTIMYKIISYTVSGTTTITQKITEADKYTYSTNDSIDSEVGLYMTYDDDGPTYYYRGNVKNNYVYFAGYYWRIIRINGDGSIRMIYAGTGVNATGTDVEIGRSSFNTNATDPTYVGYKYGTTSITPVTQDSTANYSKISSNGTYWFGTGYEEVGDGTFKLSGTLINGTFSELFGSDGMYETAITNYYTCFSSYSDGTCTVLMKLNAYNSSTSANVYYISYASESYEDTLTNANDSAIKQVVDNWYKENILNKYDDANGYLLTDYLADSVFCGDRSLYSNFTGAGYILSELTHYNANNRLSITYKPSLKCQNDEDVYTVENGNLVYPIALISADEVSFAGGKNDNVNTLYYLYTGSSYWTMTPSYFYPYHLVTESWHVNSGGFLSDDYNVTYVGGVRPVINLSSSVKISQGTGTASNPFRVTLD